MDTFYVSLEKWMKANPGRKLLPITFLREIEAIREDKINQILK